MTRLALWMRAAVLAVLVALLAPAAAAAHPLGNFTVNRLDVVRVSTDRVDVRYILDQAEIPTFQERGRDLADVLAQKQAEALRGLRLRVDGAAIELRPSRTPGRIALLPGQGGLRTTRVELLFSAPVDNAENVVLRDSSFSDRVGWRGMIAVPGRQTAARSNVPATEPTSRLRRYPTALLGSPADQRSIALEVGPGDGTVEAPAADGRGTETTTADRSGDGFAGLFDDAAAGEGTLILLLFAAFGWGALHAISPGHGKAMVAAYLIGARGTARHAVILGATVTVTHTIGVFALGVITLALSQYLLPEDLYPWLNLTAGLLVLIVGASVLRARLRGIPEGHHHDDGTHHHVHGAAAEPDDHRHGSHVHTHDHPHSHGHSHDDAHGHHHHAPASLSPRALLAAGASAGLIPCPSALVVLLGAIAQQEIALGLLLIVVFSLGLAATLTGVGLTVVSARSLSGRWRPSGRLARAAAAAAPAISAVVIVVVGIVLTARAVPNLS